MAAGGLGPELAEDHSTSMLIAAAGWRGVHAIDAIATGDGPQNFADMATQEFQWSRSLMNLMLQYTPHYLGKMPMGRRVYFIFCQLWYPLFAISSLMIFLAPLIALWTDTAFAPVTFVDFVKHFGPNAVVLVMIVYLMRSFGFARPYNAKIVSWEGSLFMLYARWPWALWGMLTGIRDQFSNVQTEFRVTPKGDGPRSLLPTRVILPYAFLAAISAAAVILVDNSKTSSGFLAFAALNAVAYTGLTLTILVMHLRENAVQFSLFSGKFWSQWSVAACLCVLSVLAVAERGLEGVHSIQAGAQPLSLVRVVYPAYGAGRGGNGDHMFSFDPSWEN